MSPNRHKDTNTPEYVLVYTNNDYLKTPFTTSFDVSENALYN